MVVRWLMSHLTVPKAASVMEVKFGTGNHTLLTAFHVSFNTLYRFNFNNIKIDGSIVKIENAWSTDYLNGENCGFFIKWLQSCLLEVCYARLVCNQSKPQSDCAEPIAYFYTSESFGPRLASYVGYHEYKILKAKNDRLLKKFVLYLL